jgi:hypothetical protein
VKIAVEHVPQCQAIDQFEEHAFSQFNLVFPFRVIPIKPFQYLMERYRMLELFTGMKESAIVESLISSSQWSLEGYVFEGEVMGCGVVDSVREGGRSSFPIRIPVVSSPGCPAQDDRDRLDFWTSMTRHWECFPLRSTAGGRPAT